MPRSKCVATVTRLLCWLTAVAVALFTTMGGVATAFALPEHHESGPEVKSPSATLMDAATGQVLWAKDDHERRPPASVTKLMTLDLVMEALASGQIKLDDMVTASAYAESWGGTQIWLEAGERMTVEALLFAVAVRSANDAAVALAEYIAGSEPGFVTMMNQRAQALGMRDTIYANVHGLPSQEDHLTSAYDQALLARHIVLSHPEVLKYTSTWEYWLRKGQKNEVWLTNTNRGLVEYPGMDGLKTGWTEAAGYCLIATAQRDGQRLIAVALGAPSVKERNRDVYSLLDYGFNNFRSLVVARADEPLTRVAVDDGDSATVPVVPQHDVVLTLPRTVKTSVERRLELPSSLRAPVALGEQVGWLIVLQGNEPLQRMPLVTVAAVEHKSLWQMLVESWRQLWP